MRKLLERGEWPVDEVLRRGVSAISHYVWVLSLGLAVFVVTAVLLVKQGGSGPIDAARAVRSVPAVTTAVAPADTECDGNETPKRIVVSLSRQHMWLCARSEPVASSPVTTGRSAVGHGTPVGSWAIVSHETSRYLEGPGYRVHVHYWLPFVGDVGFHDSPWQKFPYGDLDEYKVDGSQGCVHVPGPMMARLYDWTRVGTAVTVTT